MFFGNPFTNAETMQTYWLYRCAELTREKSFDGFEITSGITLTMEGIAEPYQVAAARAAPAPIIIYGGAGGVATPAPTIIAEIKLLKKPITEVPRKIFDADVLKLQLDAIVKGRKCEKSNVCHYLHQYLNPDFPISTVAPVG